VDGEGADANDVGSLQGANTTNTCYSSVDLAVEDVGDLADFGGQFGVFGGEDGLNAVGEGFFGLVMDFDEESIGADGDRGTGKRKDFVTLAGAVAGVDQDGQVAAFFHCGHYG